jgi:glycosyltransferase involved in cell wall biosynthesis
MNHNDFLIGIPVFNEAANLPNLLPGLEKWRENVVFYNDGSTDNSALIIKNEGFRIRSFAHNIGLSGLFAEMLIQSKKEGKSRLITLDSDCQHPPDYIEQFIEKTQTCSLVIGSRFSDISDVPDNKIASNFFAIMLTKSIFGLELPDVACGFRAFDVQKQLSFKYRTSRFGVIYEQLFSQLLAKNAKIGFVKIPAIYHKSDFYFTQYEEVIGLLESALFFSNNMIIKKVYNQALLHENIYINLCDVDFRAFYCAGSGYQFSTDINIAKNYFSSFK